VARWLAILLMLLAYIPFIQLVDGVGIHRPAGAVAGAHVIAFCSRHAGAQTARRARALTARDSQSSVDRQLRSSPLVSVGHGATRATADEMIASAARPGRSASPKPDIYVIVLTNSGGRCAPDY
jgi:hypothetical protein